MLIKGQTVNNIKLGNTLSNDQLGPEKFDYMLSNPPFGPIGKRSKPVLKMSIFLKGLSAVLARACRVYPMVRYYFLFNYPRAGNAIKALVMMNNIILIASLLFLSIGFFVDEGQLITMTGNNGQPFIPVSSGSDDPFLMRVAFSSYVISFVYACVAIKCRVGERYIIWIYLLNGCFFIFSLFLVSFDSNIIEAARAHNSLPLMICTFWAVVNVVILMGYLKSSAVRLSQCMTKVER